MRKNWIFGNGNRPLIFLTASLIHKKLGSQSRLKYWQLVFIFVCLHTWLRNGWTCLFVCSWIRNGKWWPKCVSMCTTVCLFVCLWMWGARAYGVWNGAGRFRLQLQHTFFSSISLLFPTSFPLSLCLCLPFYPSLSLWLWSVFLPPLCLYPQFGCRVCAVPWREKYTERRRETTFPCQANDGLEY